MKQTEIVKRAIINLEKFDASKHVLAGYDGLVDEIIHVVDKRKSHQEYTRLMDIKAYSTRISSAAGLSANIELVSQQIKLGGNGPVMANAMIAQQQEVSYIGALGKHFIHPVFRDFADTCRKVISIAEPGHTDALEFLDGKIMMNKTSSLDEISAETLLKKLPGDELNRLVEESDLLVLNNWSMLGGLNGIIELLNQIIKKLKRKPKVFIDLGDPKKRLDTDIRKVLRLVGNIPAETILSMNFSESTTISLVLGIKEDDIRARAELIRLQLGIHAVVIHPVNGAAISHQNESVWVKGPYTKSPKLSTGAGDNFNAGFCLGWLAGMDPGQCLSVAVCTSGYYVRKAVSPTRRQLLEFMGKWQEAGCGNI